MALLLTLNPLPPLRRGRSIGSRSDLTIDIWILFENILKLSSDNFSDINIRILSVSSETKKVRFDKSALKTA